MPVIPFKQRQQIGLEFIEFLEETERRSITNRSELKDIYITEFRNRDGVKDPNFSTLLYTLKRSNKAMIYSGKVFFHPKVRVFIQDQWRSPRSRGQLGSSNVQNGASGTSNGLPVQNAVSLVSSPGPGKGSPSPSGAEGVSGVRARRRLANIILQKLNTDKSAFISDKGDVRITSDHAMEDGRICFGVESMTEVYVVRLIIQNSGTSLVYFTYYSALHWMSCFNLKDEHKVTRANPYQLKPGESYEIQVQFRSSLIGFYPATLAFEFKPDLLPLTSAFHIVRFIEAQYVTALAKELAPIAPYRPRSILALQQAAQSYTIEDGVPPERLYVLRLKPVVPLKDYKVPAYVKELIGFLNDHPSYSPSRQNLQSAKAVLEAPLSRDNYSERFQLLLYLEELQMEVDIKRYNMENKPMVRDTNNKKLLVLEVLGVSENRPSVLRGDALLVTRPGEGTRGEAVVKYRGYVHRVELEQVKLSFNNKLLKNFIDGMKFNVEFTVNRLTTRLQQRATELVSQYRLEDVLFPSAASTPQPQLPTLRLFNSKLEKNPEQYKAVQHIVAGSSRPAPYLVFGPPGTGKTVTVVEAIKQLEKSQSSACILACAPSNSAADLLCKEIVKHVEKRKVYRMYASSRNPYDVPDELLDCCNLDEDEGNFVFPSKEELMEYKIMVTTLLTAGRLVTGGVPLGHYTHVFVDEAGHALETECIISLAGLLKVGTGQVVLAGDPKQLGPILRSPLAIKYGMGLSLLERLMTKAPLYQKDEEGTFNNRFVTKLLRNYRSHPAILKIPNELFYDGELQVYADDIVRNSYCNWEYLPKKGFPVVFHAVTGRDEREANSPSFFNVAEVEVLMDYLRKLLQNQRKKGMGTIALKDIGIIAPYRKQVEKIRKALRTLEKDLKLMDIKDLKVGSVEEFQGQERKVILVSTVRSSAKYVRIDQQFTLGFIKNEKRFNVAITRAKALLIVVGNPLVLSGDSTWDSFIQYCSEGEGYTGFDRSHAEGTEEVVERLAVLCLQAEPQVETDESQVQQQQDPEWRNEL